LVISPNLLSQTMNGLPLELLLDVFKCACEDDLVSEREPADIRIMNTISRVCRRWKHTAASAPTLWHRLRIYMAPSSNSLNLYSVPTWIANSCDLPLELDLDLELERSVEELDSSTTPPSNKRKDTRDIGAQRMRALSEMLRPHIDRLLKLTLRFDSSSGQMTRSVSASALDDAPNLRELTLTCRPAGTMATLRAFPRSAKHLQVLRTRRVMFHNMTPLSGSLHRLELAETYIDYFEVSLREAMLWVDHSQLTELRIHTGGLHVVVPTQTESRPEAAYYLPSLRILYLRDLRHGITSDLLHYLDMPALEEVTITESAYESVQEFFKYLKNHPERIFHRCRSLTLKCVPTIEVDPLISEHAFPHLVELHILGVTFIAPSPPSPNKD
jgi:hypothetical protein